MRRRLAGGALVALLALAPAARAQLAPLVPAPSRADAVLRRSDWLPLEPLNVEELLRTLVGVSCVPTGAQGSPAVLQLGGSQNGRVQVILDGVPVTDPELEGPHLQSLQVSDIDSLELCRATDPARLVIWTRKSERDSPYVDIDLGRGDLGTRTRRVQFFSPPRRVEATVSYEELLRQADDFRTHASTPPVAGLGAHNARGVTVRIGLHGNGDHLRLEYQSSEDEFHGSVTSQSDQVRTRLSRAGLRWQRQLAGTDLCFAVGQQVASRHGLEAGLAEDQSTARTHAGLDAKLPAAGAWSSWVRLRYAESSGDRAAPESLRADVTGTGAEVQVHRDGRLDCDLWTGLHQDERLGTEWSAAARARLQRGSWTGVAQAGRGISFPGWGEQAATVRRGVDAALRLVWQRGTTALSTSAVAKQFRGGSSAPALLPAAGAGPTSLGSAWLEAIWRPVRGAWQARLAGSGGWTPYQQGTASGIPTTEARFDLRGGRGFWEGDLVLTLQGGATLTSRREFAGGEVVAPAAVADVGLDARLLERANLFVSCRNVTDARAELAPGVAATPRWWLFGVRVRMLD